MEINNSQKATPQDYFSKYQSKAFITVACAQTILVFTVICTAEFLGVINAGWPETLVAAFICSLVLIAVSLLLFHVIARPLRSILHAAEESDKQPQDMQTKDMPPAISSHENNDVPVPSPILAGLDNTTTGIIIMNSGGEIMYHNQSAPVRIGTDNKPHLDLVFPDISDTFDTWRSSIKDQKIKAENQWSRIANKLPGEENRRLFDVTASYRKASEAEIILTFFDRTDLYAPEEDDLDFISFAAHELRGPITVIRGYLDVLHDELKPVLKQDQNELILRVTVASNRLTSYINNILNAARYDRRHMKLHLAEETVRHMYDLISDDMQLRANAQGRLLVADIPETLPTVAADPNAAGEVMGNLIDNAIKYSNQGGLVHVVAKATPGFVEISVIDRGIGMPSNVLPNLFHKFYRSHRSRETVAGTGIGLYICKAIVSSHGGTITARSIENEGSTFSFTLPIYDTVAEKLAAGDNSNASLIEHGSGWIKNHSMYRG